MTARRWNARAVAGACLFAGLVFLAPYGVGAQEPAGGALRRDAFDQILDGFVRDGYVYYRALKADRAKLDRYIAQLGGADVNALGRNEQIAFWLNAYNALVLRTVIDHYPVQTHSAMYPAHSIRQISGAFERATHTVGGQTLTLDQIEQTVLPAFGDPRVFFAIGRGAVGGGRLRSEAFAGEALERQLGDVARECANREECVHVDRAGDRLLASSIFSWREKDFVAAYADKAEPVFSNRTAGERAIVAYIGPTLLATEREFLSKNTFQLAYQPFDWSLNDLTGRGGR